MSGTSNLSKWTVKKSEERNSSDNGEVVVKESIDRVVRVRPKIHSARVSKRDLSEVIREIFDDVSSDRSRERALTLLTDSARIMYGGDIDEVRKEFNSQVIPDSPYNEFERYLKDIKRILDSDFFDMISIKEPKDLCYTPYGIRQDLSDVANFLDNYGVEEDILGEEYRTYLFDDPTEVENQERDHRLKDTEWRLVNQGVIDMRNLFNEGWIGIEKVGYHNGRRLTMRSNLVEKYSD